MALTIAAAPGYSNPFTAGFCALSGRSSRFSLPSPRFFGILLLEISNGNTVAEKVEVAIASPSRELSLYGPTWDVSIPPGGTFPIGVIFRRFNANVGPATGVITVSWLDPGSSTRNSVRMSVIGNVSTVATTLFIPSAFQFVASGATSKQSPPITLEAQTTAAFSVSAPAPASAFSWNPPMPTGSFVAGSGPTLRVSFDASVALQRAPRVVTVTATTPGGATSSFPFIGWCAETLLSREVVISSLNSDPPGQDLLNESITLSNTTTRRFDLTRCYLRDEAGAGQFFTFPNGFQLAAGASVRVFTRRGTNTATELFWGLPRPVWNNDFDTAVLYNSAGDEVSRFFYIFAAQNARIPGQTTAFDSVVFVSEASAFMPTTTLEDGDFVVIQPRPTPLSWAGDVWIGATGPGGDPNSVAPTTPSWPLPGAPKFALLAEAGQLVLVGGSTFTQVVNRTSAFRPNNPLNLLINDEGHGGGWGGYEARVRVFRK